MPQRSAHPTLAAERADESRQIRWTESLLTIGSTLFVLLAMFVAAAAGIVFCGVRHALESAFLAHDGGLVACCLPCCIVPCNENSLHHGCPITRALALLHQRQTEVDLGAADRSRWLAVAVDRTTVWATIA